MLGVGDGMGRAREERSVSVVETSKPLRMDVAVAEVDRRRRRSKVKPSTVSVWLRCTPQADVNYTLLSDTYNSFQCGINK